MMIWEKTMDSLLFRFVSTWTPRSKYKVKVWFWSAHWRWCAGGTSMVGPEVRTQDAEIIVSCWLCTHRGFTLAQGMTCSDMMTAEERQMRRNAWRRKLRWSRCRGWCFNKGNVVERKVFTHFGGNPFGKMRNLGVNVLQPCGGGPSAKFLDEGVSIVLEL